MDITFRYTNSHNNLIIKIRLKVNEFDFKAYCKIHHIKMTICTKTAFNSFLKRKTYIFRLVAKNQVTSYRCVILTFSLHYFAIFKFK
mgnify:CR=1 FL=1